jgi:hypothetical protein
MILELVMKVVVETVVLKKSAKMEGYEATTW